MEQPDSRIVRKAKPTASARFRFMTASAVVIMTTPLV
jgi:hypothetical protein